MAVYREGRIGYDYCEFSTPPTEAQFNALTRINEEAASHPRELILINSADLYLTNPSEGFFESNVGSAIINRREHLGIIPNQGPIVTNEGNQLKFHPTVRASFITLSNRFVGNTRELEVKRNPLGGCYPYSSLDLGALERPAQDYVGDDYQIIESNQREQPMISVAVGDEAVKGFKKEELHKQRVDISQFEREWWKMEAVTSQTLVDFHRLQKAVGRVVLPVPLDIQKLAELQVSSLDGSRLFAEELLELAQRDKKGEREVRFVIVAYARAAVLAGLTRIKNEVYKTPTLEGIDGSFKSLDVGELIRSVCENYGIEYPKLKKTQPRFHYF